MAAFGFDDRYAMFDVTPVTNQFIVDLLPGARGDFVKVYLYGLMKCYHPEGETDLDEIAGALRMSREDILSAFRYWERRRVVRRISDDPPTWRFLSPVQQMMAGEDSDDDPEFEAFSNAIYEAFDNERRLHGSELVTCFEWHEELKLPTEVIIMLLKHMVSMRGKQFNFKEADRTATQMAQENVRSMEAAEDFLARDREMYDGTRRVLRKLGRHYAPSEAQVALYSKWIREWHFTAAAVEEAVKQTAGGDPSMGYLDAILEGIRNQSAGGKAVQAEQVRHSENRRKGLREVFRAMGRGSVNEETLKLYDEMLGLYDQEILILAARECRGAGRSPEDLLELLKAWKKRGLNTREEIQQHLDAFHQQTALQKELLKKWGADGAEEARVPRTYLTRWTGEWGMSRELILKAAEYAATARKPADYLDRLLKGYQEKGIRTPEEAERDHASGGARTGSPARQNVTAQQYVQRDYSGMEEEAMERMFETDGGMTDDA
ncbi:MAG: DnaD domain protein [Clostridia bacterium]|nr:DnaD domain protein [Clostridia bacterium]